MNHGEKRTATGGQTPTAADDHAQAVQRPPVLEELPDDYAEWLDGWMAADIEEQPEVEP